MTRPLQIYIKTYGCQMNERDSAALAGKLMRLGHAMVEREEEADVLIFNTCSVRDQAERKAVGKISYLKKLKRRKPELLIGVIGCMAQNRGESLFRELPHLDFVVGTGQLHQLPEIIASLREDRRQIARLATGSEVLTEMGVHQPEAKLSDFIAITRGCNRFCAYCIVPYVRGREISREIGDVVAEARELVANGTREIMLLGQNVAAFGWNGNVNPPPDDVSPFADLLKELQQIEGLYRIRFTSPYPSYFNAKLIAVMAECSKVCHSVHLPLQSGSARVLKAMNRQYTPEQYLQIVGALRQAMPDIAFSTDVIVGFPTESAAEFEETCQLMERVGFDNAFIFKYSPRAGTRSAEMPDDVPQAVKEARNQRLLQLLSASAWRNNRQLVGTCQEVLVEGPSHRNPARWTGKTATAKSVMFAPQPSVRRGDLHRVTIARVTDMTLFADDIPDLPSE
ncbi:tRNA (N6-isopentenyl adenosine(37)-C2)-methylthiotransferase MiaB [Victivallis sp. Marseille-Q1083]|uniref:tRNA (N6-isopentenyl adenosine(37)-C2)-methylthiotransferase MiaB n=1 Tax=Victivallis sp. Marseille-Q1083 TaxID=2717288 RepID=UPI00158C9F98|nr:tRNA (N6-isopentenyl adenosine(37)-C2)-methylthiotransferase MiaB [Victivallis sp. Marseille-Q1083]